MRAFKDKLGVHIDVAIDFSAIRRIQARTGHNLATLALREPAKLFELAQDPLESLAILHAATLHHLSQDEFEARMDCGTVEAGMLALLEELADFFHGEKRQLVQAMVAEFRRLLSAAYAEAMSLMLSAPS